MMGSRRLTPGELGKSFRNPQEPPFSRHNNNGRKRLPVCIYDLFFDLPHPAATAVSDRARVIDPPVVVCPQLAEEMYNPENITRLSRLAFPEHDDGPPAQLPVRRSGSKQSAARRKLGTNLSKYDVYLVDFIIHHHTFSLLLSDGKTRVHGHVRRYLPPHMNSASRTDVGRRGPRAMVLLTRATGGERFYASVLKTVEAVVAESNVAASGIFGRKKAPARAFLHALFNNHAQLITEYANLRWHGFNLNFTHIADGKLEGEMACKNAKMIMEQNENLFKVSLSGVEFACDRNDESKKSNFHMGNDTLRFYLPFTLQPGFDCIAPETIPEDIYSPIVPLLRYIGPGHLVRLLSALLCERRIILISKSITRLSMCVRAASSMLAQGLLLWRHIEIPVVPPHMLKFLSVKAPYIVGILEPYAPRISRIEGLTDVLCVNVDTNEVTTFNMTNPRITVPDMLKKGSKKTDPVVSAAEMLANDLDEIFQADQKLWQHDEKVGGKEKESGARVETTAPAAFHGTSGETGKKTSLVGKIMGRPKLDKQVSSAAKRMMSLEEKRQYATSVDAAVAFGRMIRANFQRDSQADEYSLDQDDYDFTSPKYSSPSHELLGGIDSLEACTVSENEGGEEDARAALACFFIHMYGDMGMYLSETGGTFWLDRRKFLLRKKQLGEKENSPTFLVLRKFSSSSMFETFVKGRIDDMCMTARDRSSIMPHHIPLFDICSKYLSINRLEFSLTNVRRIVAKTVITCTRHIAVEKGVAIRVRTLALTADTPFEGNVATALSDLVESCRECNTNLSVVMSVIWYRLGQTKASMWRHPLLALHLLKNLLLHGPLTAITEALDGVEKIHELKSFSNAKSVEAIREVRIAADQVYELLSDLARLYLRRRRIAYAKVQQPIIMTKRSRSWAEYLVSRLPFTVGLQHLHYLFRPDGVSGRSHHESSVSVTSSAGSLAASFRALQRLDSAILSYGETGEIESPRIGTTSSKIEDIAEQFYHGTGDHHLCDGVMRPHGPSPQSLSSGSVQRSEPSGGNHARPTGFALNDIGEPHVENVAPEEVAQEEVQQARVFVEHTGPNTTPKEEVRPDPKVVHGPGPEAAVDKEYGPGPEAVSHEEYGLDAEAVSHEEYGPDPEAVTREEYGPDPEAVIHEEYGPDAEAVTHEEYGPDPEVVTHEEYGPDPEAVTHEEYVLDPEAVTHEEHGPDSEAVIHEEYGPDPEAVTHEEYGPDAEAVTHEEHGPGPVTMSHEGHGLGPETMSHGEFESESESMSQEGSEFEPKMMQWEVFGPQPETSSQTGSEYEPEIFSKGGSELESDTTSHSETIPWEVPRVEPEKMPRSTFSLGSATSSQGRFEPATKIIPETGQGQERHFQEHIGPDLVSEEHVEPICVSGEREEHKTDSEEGLDNGIFSQRQEIDDDIFDIFGSSMSNDFSNSGADILESFNFAVSSHAGSYFSASVGGSDANEARHRSASPIERGAERNKMIHEQLRQFSFLEDSSQRKVIDDEESTGENQSNDSFLGEDSKSSNVV